MSDYIKEIIIDEECTFCPFGIKKKKGETTPQYSDHNAIITTCEIPHRKKKEIKQHGWKISEDGLKIFEEITSSNDFPIEIEEGNGQERYTKYEKLVHQTMNKCFKKRKAAKAGKISGNNLILYRKAMSFAKKGKAQRKVAKTYIQAIHNANLKLPNEQWLKFNIPFRTSP